LKDKERIQPRAGRLDILLQEPETKKRYTVEIQLGKTDEAHLVRTLEYYDIERKRYPQYQHCAVIVAEDITTRFLNVISMFNGTIPLIALQMKAYEVGNDVALVFTKILDEVNLGLVDEDEEIQELVDRDYWLKKSSSDVMKLTEECLTIMKSVVPDVEFKYNKHYIGLTTNGYTNNFITIGPRKKFFVLSIRINSNEEVKKMVEESGLDVREYNRWGRYDISIQKSDLKDNKELIESLIKLAWEENN
jgi:predicted transport protein